MNDLRIDLGLSSLEDKRNPETVAMCTPTNNSSTADVEITVNAPEAPGGPPLLEYTTRGQVGNPGSFLDSPSKETNNACCPRTNCFPDQLSAWFSNIRTSANMDSDQFSSLWPKHFMDSPASCRLNPMAYMQHSQRSSAKDPLKCEYWFPMS